MLVLINIHLKKKTIKNYTNNILHVLDFKSILRNSKNISILSLEVGFW